MEHLEIYNLSMRLSQRGWELVERWPYFAKETMGKQLVRSFDSISANIAEGSGRYSFREKVVFFIYARGSLFETKCWLQKAQNRGLLDKDIFEIIIQDLGILHIKLNNFIKATRSLTKK